MRVAQDAFNQYRPSVVLGARAIDSKCAPLVLIAPVWRKWGSVTSVKPSTLILHSEHDAIIPIDDSRELVSNSGLPETAFRPVGNDHFMVDAAVLGAQVAAVKEAARQTNLLGGESPSQRK